MESDLRQPTGKRDRIARNHVAVDFDLDVVEILADVEQVEAGFQRQFLVADS
jgi:hypothetical protein